MSLSPSRGSSSALAFPTSPHSQASVVCHCFQISEREILAAIDRGAASVPEVFAATKGEGGCRGCECRVERMLRGLSPWALRCDRCGGSSLLCNCEAGAGYTEVSRLDFSAP